MIPRHTYAYGPGHAVAHHVAYQYALVRGLTSPDVIEDGDSYAHLDALGPGPIAYPGGHSHPEDEGPGYRDPGEAVLP